MRDHTALIDWEIQAQVDAWFSVSKAASDAGWIEDWLNDPRPETITWAEYISWRIRNSNTISKE